MDGGANAAKRIAPQFLSYTHTHKHRNSIFKCANERTTKNPKNRHFYGISMEIVNGCTSYSIATNKMSTRLFTEQRI